MLRKEVFDSYIDITICMIGGYSSENEKEGDKAISYHHKFTDSTGIEIKFSFFVLVMDELTKRIQNEIPQCMLFAGIVVLVAGLGKEYCPKQKGEKSILNSNDLYSEKRIMQF